MQWLKRAFVLALRVRDLLGIARPTPPVGPVPPEPTIPIGSLPSAPDTQPQLQPAKQAPKAVKKAASKIKAAAKPSRDKVPAQTLTASQSGVRGN